MRAVLAHVSNLRGERIVELMLQRQIPLLSHGRTEVRIKYPDSVSGVALEVDGRTRRNRRAEAGGDVTGGSALGGAEEWRVLRESLVGSSAFRVFRDRVSTTQHCFALKERRR